MTDPRKPGESQKAYAARIIRERILSMDLEPGRMISENELSQFLGISRTPVREALHDLTRTQIIEIMPQRGCRVAFIDYHRIEEARFTRQTLETAILPKVCQKLTPESCQTLRQILDEQDQVLGESDENGASFMRLDNLFHATLFEIADMSTTHQWMAEMQIHFDRVRQIALTIGKGADIVKDHRAILDALEKGDTDLAQQLMTRHLSAVTVDMDAVKCAYPQYVVQNILP